MLFRSALAPTDIDATLHAQLCATSPSYKEHHAKCKNGKWSSSPKSPIKQGAIHYDGIFKFFPCCIAARTPERLDSDPVITMCLACCSNPDSCGCGRPSLEETLQQELIAQGYSESFMYSPGPSRHGVPAKLFPKHSVSSSYVPPEAPPAMPAAPEPSPIPEPDVPADSMPPAEEPGSPFKHGPRNAPAVPDDESVIAWVEQQLARNITIDQGILPKSHLLHHSTADPWHKICTTCRAGLQRRKAAKKESTSLEVRQVPYAPYGDCIRLDTEDCHLEANTLAGEDAVQYFEGLRYDLIAVDCGTGWNFSEPIADKQIGRAHV